MWQKPKSALDCSKTSHGQAKSRFDFKPGKLGLKLVTVTLVCILIPLTLIYILTKHETEGILTDQIGVINQQTVNAVSAEVKKFIAEVEVLTTELGESETANLFISGMGDFITMDLEDIRTKYPWIKRFELAAEDGSVVIYPEEPSKVNTQLQNSLWYKEAKAEDRLIWMPATNKSDYFRLAIPIKFSYNDQVAGIFSLIVDLGQFTHILQQYSIDKGTILLINQSGAVLASDQVTEVDATLFDQVEFFQQACKTEDILTGIYTYAKTSRLTYAKYIPQLKAIVLVQLPEKAAFAAVRELLFKLQLVALFTLVSLFIVLVLVSRFWITNQISALVKSADLIAKGDLQGTNTVKSEDEVGMLARSFNIMRTNLRDLIQDIHKNAVKVADSSEHILESTEVSTRLADQVSSSIQQVAAGAEHQSSLIEEVNDKLTHLSQSVDGLAVMSNNVREIAETTKSKANLGMDSMKRVVDQMDMIQQSITESTGIITQMTQAADEIGNFVNLIDNIASQTNLLALNAAIEAARAGEEGRGFAVVAAEIRSLAEEVSVSAGKIRQLVESTQQYSHRAANSMETGASKIAMGQEAVQTSGDMFTDIYASFEQTHNAIQQVNDMIVDLSQNISRIVAGSDKIAEIAQENAAAAEEVAASTEEQAAAVTEITNLAEILAGLSRALEGLVQKFKL